MSSGEPVGESQKNPLSAPSITRLARRAGVKSMSKDCLDIVRLSVDEQVASIVEKTLIVSNTKNNRQKGKVLAVEDVYTALSLMGHQVAQSNELGKTTCGR